MNVFVILYNQKNRIYKTLLDEKGEEPVDLYLLDTNSNFVATEFAKNFKDSGATILGGCCETRPSHIEAMAKLK